MGPANPDALLSLRQAIRNKYSITYSNNDSPCSSLLNATHIVLEPDASFPKSASTRLRKQGVTTASDIQDYHTLEAVYLAWLLRDAPGGEYMKQARENGLAVGFVSVTERKNVVDWLEGKVVDYERIVPLAGMFCITSLRRQCFTPCRGVDNAPGIASSWQPSITIFVYENAVVDNIALEASLRGGFPRC